VIAMTLVVGGMGPTPVRAATLDAALPRRDLL
jgi:hypothetical protein